MSVISIKNRIGRMEDERGIGRRPVVVIGPNETEEAAFARVGLKPGDDAQVLRVVLVSAGAA